MAKALHQLKDGEKYEGFVLIKHLSVRSSANGSNFADLQVADLMSEINAKIWNVESSTLEGISAFNVVKLRGVAKLFNGKMQLSVSRIRPTEPEDGVDIDDFVPHSAHSPKDMWTLAWQAAQGISHEKIRALVCALLESRKEALLYYPAAARLHHSVRGGLLEHITTMLSAARHMLEVYPVLNADLLIAGVLLHDLGKIEEFKVDATGLVDDYSAEGKLLGHIIMGVEQIGKAAQEVELDSETTLLLQHMVLSHHNQPEFGSPRYPMFIEAEMLHHLDVLDARMDDFAQAQSCLEPGSFSEPVFHLDKRRVYRPAMTRE